MKKIISLLLAITLLLSITGCHGNAEEKVFRIPDTFDTSRQYEISFWAKNDTNITQVEIYKQAIADFEALYPNVTVNLRLYTDYGKIYNDVITNIATDTTPNVCITYPDHIATYLTGSDTVVPLDELFAHPLHPYTRSLLSAIPLPDPHSEKNRTRITYNSLAEHDYSVDKPTMREITPGHFVYCNDAEERKYKEELGL